jgi:hypothetical protein
MQACVMCSSSFELSEHGFEQRLIDDVDFCPRCWQDIMTMEYEESFVPIQ